MCKYLSTKTLIDTFRLTTQGVNAIYLINHQSILQPLDLLKGSCVLSAVNSLRAIIIDTFQNHAHFVDAILNGASN